MSDLSKALSAGEFVVTGEIGPPKGTNLENCLKKEADPLKNQVHAINVTDTQSAVMRMGPVAPSVKLLERGIEPVLQLTGRDRNRLALQAELLSAWELGIKNVLCLTGDHHAMGDHGESKQVYDLDSVHLLKTINTLNEGNDLAGQKLKGSPDIFAGAVVNPGSEPVEMQVLKMKKKHQNGAKFFQTQAVFDPYQLESFLEETKDIKAPILAGIVLLKSSKMARYMNENVPGVKVPENIIQELENTPKEKLQEKSAEIAARLIKELKDLCQGVHIMPLGWSHVVPKALELADLTQMAEIKN